MSESILCERDSRSRHEVRELARHVRPKSPWLTGFVERIGELSRAETLSNRGGTRAERGELLGALADLNTAIALDATLGQAYVNRGNVLARSGRWEEALADYEYALSLGVRPALVMCNRATARQALGDLRGAIEDLDCTLEFAPRFAPGYLQRGAAHAEQGQVHEALQDLETFLRLAPLAPERSRVETLVRRLKALRVPLSPWRGDFFAPVADWSELNSA